MPAGTGAGNCTAGIGAIGRSGMRKREPVAASNCQNPECTTTVDDCSKGVRKGDVE